MTDLADLAPRSRDLLGPLLEGDPEPVRELIVEALATGQTRCSVYDTVLLPCLRQIGELWQHGEIAVPDEHLASHTLIGVLQDVRSAPVTSPRAPTAVVGCAPLEGHAIPALLAGDLLADAGWRVWQLGASAPADELAAFVRRHDPRLLVLTTALTRTLTGVTAVTRALRGHTGTATMAGGAGVKHLSKPSEIGVDALGHRLGDLLDFAATLTSGPPQPVRAVAGGGGQPPGHLSPGAVEDTLREAGTSLSISEITERCGATSAQVGVALTQLERVRRVRFVGGRWRLGVGGR